MEALVLILKVISGIVVLYMAVRAIMSAYFHSKLWYEREQGKKQEDED